MLPAAEYRLVGIRRYCPAFNTTVGEASIEIYGCIIYVCNNERRFQIGRAISLAQYVLLSHFVKWSDISVEAHIIGVVNRRAGPLNRS
jgi:hypothetical protein